MKRHSPRNITLPNLSRRLFVEGLAVGGALLGLSSLSIPAWASAAKTKTGMVPVLSGTEFDLLIAETPVNYTGSPRMATTVNGSLPAPILRWREGDTITIRVTNHMKQSIHQKVGPEGEETLRRDYDDIGTDFVWKPGQDWDSR